jgi:adenylate cyclase
MRSPRAYTSTILIFLFTFVAALLSVAEPVRAAELAPVVLKASTPSDALFASATYLDDPKASYTIDDVSRRAERNAFTTFPSARRADRVVQGWFRFALRTSPSDAANWTIEAPLSCDTFDVYVQRGNGTFSVAHAGMLVPFADRDPLTPSPVFTLTADATSGRPVYVHIAANRALAEAPVLFFAVPTQHVAADYEQQHVVDTFFGGLFFAILVTNLFLAFYLRDRTFFAYVVAMALHVLTQFTQDGTAWVLFWPHASLPFGIPSVIAEALFFASLAVFWRIFLNLPARFPVIDKILLALVGVSMLRSVLTLIVPQPTWLTFADFPVAYALIVTALTAAVMAARQGYRPARFLIVALSGLLFFWGVAYPIEWLDQVPPGLLGNLINNGIYYGVAWDALFLTFALADRIETAKRAMLAAQAETVERLRERDVAVSRFLPRAFLEHLGRASVVDLRLGDHVEREMTILFSDIRSFTTLSESMSPGQTFRFLNAYLRRAGPIIRDHDGFIDKYIGDALMGLFPNAAHTALDAAIALQRSVHEHNRELLQAGEPAIAIGVGLHRGMLMLGTIGESERIETTVIADAVNVAARTESLTKQFRAPVIATEAAIRDVARRDDYRIRPLGEVVVYGATRGMRMFEVFDGDPPDMLNEKTRTLDDFSAGVRAFTAGDFVRALDAFAGVLEQSPQDQTAAYFAERSRSLIQTAPDAPWDGRTRMDVK